MATIPPDERELIKRRIADILEQMDAIPVSLHGGLTTEWQALLSELISLGQRLLDDEPPGGDGMRNSVLTCPRFLVQGL